MRNELKTAAGYQFMFFVPVLLLIGIEIGAPSFAFGVVIFVLPLARRYFGKLQPDDTPLWNERLASFLDRLPLVYAFVLTATVMVVLWSVAQAGTLSAGYAVGLGLSLWMTMLFATCVAHDLIHRRDRKSVV